MNMASGTRPQRMLLAVILAIFALFCDKASLGASRGHFQEALWTVSVVALFLIELRRTLHKSETSSPCSVSTLSSCQHHVSQERCVPVRFVPGSAPLRPS